MGYISSSSKAASFYGGAFVCAVVCGYFYLGLFNIFIMYNLKLK